MIGRRAAVALAVGCLALAGCSPQMHDLENVPLGNAEKVEVFANVNNFPNVVAMCIHGAGFVTTTRDSGAALRRVEEWDAGKDGWCAQ